jgi:hypothetical protein
MEWVGCRNRKARCDSTTCTILLYLTQRGCRNLRLYTNHIFLLQISTNFCHKRARKIKKGLPNVWVTFTPFLFCTSTQTSIRKSKFNCYRVLLFIFTELIYICMYVCVCLCVCVCVCYLKCKNFNICDRYNEIILKIFLKFNVFWYNVEECRQCSCHRHAPK